MVKSNVELGGALPAPRRGTPSVAGSAGRGAVGAARSDGEGAAAAVAEANARFALRRDLGTASARSLLMTVLGEFALPSSEPVWTSALVAGLGLLGVGEKAARQSLARMARAGWITPQRLGRRTSWRLTSAGRELLSTGAERIYGFVTATPDWDGKWLLVLASAPEGSRRERNLLRTRLAWSGLGSIGPGVWISPHPARQAEVRHVLEEMGMAGGSTFFVASLGQLGDPRRLARRAWNLTAVGLRYDQFIRQVGDLRPSTPRETFAAQVRMVQEWRRFPLLDPGLPADVLPHPWVGTKATALFRARHANWKPAAVGMWRALVVS